VDLYEEGRRRGRAPKILLTRLRYLGDVILTTPAIRALKECYPEAEIHYLADEPYASLLEHDPHLAGVVGLKGGAAGTLRAAARLRRGHFTAAIDLFYNPRSALLLYLGGIPIRIGGSRRLRRRLYTETFSVPRGVRSAIAHHLYPLRSLGCDAEESMPRLYLTDAERASGRALLGAVRGPAAEGPVVAVHPGGTWPAKRWPPDRFGRMAAIVSERVGAHALFVAGPGEERIAREAAAVAGPNASVLPLQRLRPLAAILDACRAVVANDGGVLHMAVALSRPTVGIFGPTEPDIWFPYRGRGPFLLVTRNEDCAPCHRHACEDLRCLLEIEPEEVASKVIEVCEGSAR
jgi:lipopolysaccharide heptosyltransferase II